MCPSEMCTIVRHHVCEKDHGCGRLKLCTYVRHHVCEKDHGCGRLKLHFACPKDDHQRPYI